MNYLILFFLFLSGATGLIYEIVWTRQLVLVFGATTPTIIAVLSSFMAGLALGSLIFGRLADRFNNLIFLYALLEIAVGITTLFIPVSLPMIVLATVFMGGTLPVIVRFLKSGNNSLSNMVSLAYGVNTLGAVAGTLLGAFVLIELLGLSQTALLGSSLNLTIGLFALIVSQVFKHKKSLIEKTKSAFSFAIVKSNWEIYLAFALSGVLGMSYEVIWTRLLTPLTGTFVYAFAFVLSLYLLGIALGSFLASRLEFKNFSPKNLFGLTQFLIGFGALFILVYLSNGPAVHSLYVLPFLILPATVAMGLTFPFVARIKTLKNAEGGTIGSLYAGNTIGALIGPIIAGFIIIPLLGSVNGLLALILINFLLGALLVDKKMPAVAFSLLFLAFIVFMANWKPYFFQPLALKNKLYVFRLENYAHLFLEDETASVLAYRAKDKRDNGLLVDGVGMSDLVDETKFMAHLPLLVHPNPKDMLVIAFGMGTTFRSALVYDINVDAVDLVPSVPQSFAVFFDNAKTILKNPKANIFINDGRNFVKKSKKKYDVIQVDPPPPVNSAGTTLLYSKEFYRDSKKILKTGGIFNQWMHEGTSEEDFKLLVKTFIDQFKYVAAFTSVNHMGLHLLGSDEPIIIDEAKVKIKLQNPKVSQDLREWSPWLTDDLFLGHHYGDKSKLLEFVAGSEIVTDDRPRTEYFLIRHLTSPQKDMEADKLPK